LCRQSVYCNTRDYNGLAGPVKLSLAELFTPPEFSKSQMQLAIEQINPPNHRRFDDDRPLSVSAVCFDEGGFDKIIDLTALFAEDTLIWQKPAGLWRVYACGLSRNLGPHRGHINMMDRDSCRLLIDAVYEPHYAHYKEEFGKTIAGFFSDEPELGNGLLYPWGNLLGTPQDLPWSRALEEELPRALGEGWENRLFLLWEYNADPHLTAKVRCAYMDAVTRLVEGCFSRQIGDWCEKHGAEYIGHVIEDNNQHARTGSSLGHFFRGLAGQHMAGIDNIGGQVLPQGEDEPETNRSIMPRDGEFYHYLLGKLASSHAAIDPRKKGRALCEIFGAYGWREGVQLEKYLIDHFLVRGVNYFVPHAFSPKPYPDPDCPPHFYAQGHNPQYRHFGELMRYTNRLCNILSGGTRAAPVAILYHAEAEWSGGEYMLTQKPVRQLLDNQIDCDVIPADVFVERDRYQTSLEGGLRVNAQRYKALVIPAAEWISTAVAEAATELRQNGFPVIFVDQLPQGICEGNNELLKGLEDCTVVPLENLPAYLRSNGVYKIEINPPNKRLRYLHYQNSGDIYFFVNEGTEDYTGSIRVPSSGTCFIYNAWYNHLEKIDSSPSDEGTTLSVCVEPRKSLAVVFGETGEWVIPKGAALKGIEIPINGWKRSVCKSIEYPNFGSTIPVDLPDSLAEEQPEFSGYIRYETSFQLDEAKPLMLEITDAAEGVEVFVNGKSAGIQIVPPFRYALSGLVQKGENHLTIEVATTLERERYAAMANPTQKAMAGEPSCGSGITGIVTLKY
jgi:hypothetical protein